jgi:hypothetical protein
VDSPVNSIYSINRKIDDEGGEGSMGLLDETYLQNLVNQEKTKLGIAIPKPEVKDRSGGYNSVWYKVARFFA